MVDKKIIREEQPASYTNKVVWVTKDGKEYTYEMEAIRHEKYLDAKFVTDRLTKHDEWYFVTNAGEVDAVYEVTNDTKSHIDSIIAQVPVWIKCKSSEDWNGRTYDETIVLTEEDVREFSKAFE